jgi:hypothetical protein
LFINQLHEYPIIVRFTPGFVIQAAAVQAQQFTLTGNRDIFVLWLNGLPLLVNRQDPIFFFSQSSSTFN